MNINDSLNLLNLSSPTTQLKIKKAYKTACIKYHPDRNPAGAKMTVAINAAYDSLKSLGDIVKGNDTYKENDYAEELSEILNSLLLLDDLIIEVCGNWIWIWRH